MTTNDISNRLSHIDRDIRMLLSDTGYCDYEGFRFVACPPADYEGRFRLETMEKASRSLLSFHELFGYLSLPAGESHVLHTTRNGRYGYQDKDGSLFEFHCGQDLEAFIQDDDGSHRWVKTRIEHDGSRFYLVGFKSIPLDGLTVRRRGNNV